MTEKEFKKLSREDLLELLVSQNREAERLDQEILILTDQLKRLKNDFDKTETLYNTLARYNIVLPNRNIDAVRQELVAVIRKCQSGEVRAEFEKRVAGISNSELFTGNRDYEENENGSVLAEGIMDMANDLAEKIGDVTRGNAGSGKGKTIVSDSAEDKDAGSIVSIASDKESAEKIAEESVISDEFEEDDSDMEKRYDEADTMRNGTDDPEYGLDGGDISETSEYEKSPKKSGAKMSRVEEALAWAKMQFGGKK